MPISHSPLGEKGGSVVMRDGPRCGQEHEGDGIGETVVRRIICMSQMTESLMFITESVKGHPFRVSNPKPQNIGTLGIHVIVAFKKHVRRPRRLICSDAHNSCRVPPPRASAS